LFQVLRDDFISWFVRGCWLVSFFFTPIYMLILVFVVSFGAKKGTILTYASYWYSNFYNNFQLLTTSLNNKMSPTTLKLLLLHRFQFTIITSRTTIYLLFSFWCFFFFFGEILLLLTFNYNNLTDLIPSNFFMFTKSHVIFLLDNGNAYLNDVIFFYILFFTTCSFLFLLNLRYSFNYQFFQHQFLIDILFILINLYLFQFQLLYIVYTLFLFKRLTSLK
jgi:hypothetical protein